MEDIYVNDSYFLSLEKYSKNRLERINKRRQNRGKPLMKPAEFYERELKSAQRDMSPLYFIILFFGGVLLSQFMISGFESIQDFLIYCAFALAVGIPIILLTMIPTRKYARKRIAWFRMKLDETEEENDN